MNFEDKVTHKQWQKKRKEYLAAQSICGTVSATAEEKQMKKNNNKNVNKQIVAHGGGGGGVNQAK